MTRQKTPRGHLQKLIRTGHPDKPDECWPWPGVKAHDGYGQVRHDGRMQLAHHVAYELHVETVPDGFDIDHICHERDCFNPRHLQPVTHVENLQNRGGLNASNTSGYRGVYWHKQSSRWRVQVVLDGIKHHGGSFQSLEDAAAAAERLRTDLDFRDTTDRRKASSTAPAAHSASACSRPDSAPTGARNVEVS